MLSVLNTDALFSPTMIYTALHITLHAAKCDDPYIPPDPIECAALWCPVCGEAAAVYPW